MLEIGLLCVQASAEMRPSMSTVVQMLTDDSVEIPEPTRPPFWNPSSSDISQYSPTASYNSLPKSYTQSSREYMIDPKSR